MEVAKIIDEVLELSKADETMVVAVSHDKTNLRWANSGLTTNGREQHRYLMVVSVIDRCVGTYIASLNRATDISQLVSKSELAARQSPKAADYIAPLKGNGQWPDFAAGKPLDSPGGLAKRLGRAFKQADHQQLKIFGYCELGNSEYWLANSSGLRRHHVHTQGQLELNAKTSDYKLSVWAGMPLKSFAEADVDALMARILQKAEWSRRTIKLPAGKYEVILEPSAVSDMLLFAYWESSARTALEGHSAYSTPGGTVIGSQQYAKDISIYSDPNEPGLEVPPFNVTFQSSNEESIFDNGLEFTKTDWVKNGVQRHLLAQRYLAKAQKLPQPTPFIPNLIFKAAGKSLDDMIRRTKKGLLISTFWYMREVDPQNLLVTGLTRDGVFLIENGQVIGAVNNFRFNMSPLAMLKQVSEVGQSSATLAREFGDYFPLTHMPILRVKDFNMSSVSKAK